jgi:chaperonin GroEL
LAVLPRSRPELTRCLKAAALGDEAIAGALLTAFERAGRDGVIRILSAFADPPREKVRVSVQRGLRFPLAGPVAEERRELSQVAILVSLRPLGAEEARRALAARPRGTAGLLCLCPGVDAGGADLLRNAARDGAGVLLCDAPRGRWQDWFQDVAVATRANPVGPDEEGPAEITPSRLGRAGLVRVEGGELVIERPAGPPGGGQPWIARLHRHVAEASSDEEMEWHCIRLAQLTGGAVTVEVCGQSSSQTEQLDGLCCGTLHAGRATVAYGYVPGGGVAYLRGGAADLEGPAGRALAWALEAPTRALLAGAGLDVKATLASLRADERLGLDAARGELPQWRSEGPVDPASVVRTVIGCAVESAIRAGVAGIGDDFD